MDRGRILRFFSLFFVLILLGYFASHKTLDPDFGWHLRTGKLILKRGVPYQDWYSFTMPSFPWIDHEWLTDVLIYKIYSLLGLKYTLVFFLALSVLSFIVLIEERYFWYYSVPILIGYLACLVFLGIRPQIITVLFIAVFWRALKGYLDSNNKLIYFSPFLFLVWVNLHGGFAAGLFLFLLVLSLETLKKFHFFKKLNFFFACRKFDGQSLSKIRMLFLLLILSFLATLINPYGPRIYEEVFRTIGDSFLGFHIVEWLPLFFTSSFPVFTVLYLSLFSGLFVIFHKKIDITYLVVLFVFLVLALLHQRHFFIFVVLSVPTFAKFLFYLKESINIVHFKNLFLRWGKLIFVLVTSVFLVITFFFSWNSSRENDYLVYPSEGAISFLRSLPLSENLLNEYDWGGYLIWKLPKRKLFIDGRMPSWRQNGRFVFGDYVKIMKADDNLQTLLKKYRIKLVILKERRKTRFLKEAAFKDTENRCVLFERLASCQKIQERILLFFLRHRKFSQLFGLHLDEKNIYGNLIKYGWKVIYEDKTSIILKK